MLAGPRSVAIQDVREREKYRSGNGGVIKRKVRGGGMWGCWGGSWSAGGSEKRDAP